MKNIIKIYILFAKNFMFSLNGYILNANGTLHKSGDFLSFRPFTYYHALLSKWRN
ncbi:MULTISPECIES: hypothetical protein [unclassified Niallia]|uniref:hypothetical protein n=1 Tax=unclassified Niallia TaxID=2837522 RepID=UPI0030F63AD1